MAFVKTVKTYVHVSGAYLSIPKEVGQGRKKAVPQMDPHIMGRKLPHSASSVWLACPLLLTQALEAFQKHAMFQEGQVGSFLGYSDMDSRSCVFLSSFPDRKSMLQGKAN